MKNTHIFLLSWILVFIGGCGGPETEPTTDDPLLPDPSMEEVEDPTQASAQETDIVGDLLPEPSPEPEKSAIENFISEYEETLENLLFELEDYYSEVLPLVKVGDQVSLRKLNGFVNEGTITELGDDEMLLKTGFSESRDKYTSLDAFSRFRADGNFRVSLIALEAKIQTYSRLSGDHDISTLSAETTAENFDFTTLVSEDDLLEKANSTFEGGNYVEAFFLYGILSRASNPQALRQLAMMYFRGQGCDLDRGRGELLLNKSAEAGDEEAVRLLAEYKRQLAAYESRAVRETRPAEPSGRAVEQRNTQTSMMQRSFDPIPIERNIRDRPVRLVGEKRRGHQVYRESQSDRKFFVVGGRRVYHGTEEW